MELNNKKFEYVSHKSATHTKNLDMLEILPFSQKHSSYITSSSHQISRSSCVRDLGVMVDDNLSWKFHIDKVTKACQQLCGWALSVFHTRDRQTLLTIFNSLIRSKLEYCSEIWHPHLIKEIVKIEQVQRSFTSKIQGMQNINYWDRLRELGIMSLQRRRERIIIIHVWKILFGVYPNTIELEFKVHSRSGSVRAIIKPLPKLRGRLLTSFDESFIVKAAKLWNVLPAQLTDISSPESFKNKLNEFLRELPDRPPLPGYPYTCDNSLSNVCM